MSLDPLSNLESKLEVTLPDQYRELMASHPFPDSGSSNYELCSDYEALLRENESVRADGFFGVDWNPTWFVIGFDGCGNDYFITTKPFDGRIYFADHEAQLYTDDVRQNYNYDSFAEYVEFLHESEEEIRRDELIIEESLAKSIKNRKWWQFWVPRQ